MVIVGSVRRSTSAIETYGKNVKVMLHIGEDQRIYAIIHTSKSYLVVYTISLDSLDSHFSDTRYKLDTSRVDTSRRRSIIGMGDVDPILPYYIKYKRTIKVDSGLSSYVLHSLIAY
jgi:hypothetical protein